MIISTRSLLLIAFSFIVYIQAFALEDEKQLTNVNLKYITGSDVISVLNSLIDQSVYIEEKDNVLSITGSAKKTKNILQIIRKIDTPPVPLVIEFIASNRKINFNKSPNNYQSNKSKNKTSQSMAITERQWVTLNTGISIPIAERRRYADGTESQSFRYKKISKQYVFKVHEFSGWSVVQVGLNTSELSENIAGAIAHTQLNTTIIGKTDEWIEVTSHKSLSNSQSGQTYSTNRATGHQIYLYVKVKKPTQSPNIITEIEKNK